VLVTKRHVAEGPIASISTTTRDRIEIDDETRHVSLWVDESEQQTRRVIDQYLVRESPLTDDELKAWHEAYCLIEKRARTPITIPDWFPIMAKQVYDGSVTVRRYFPAFVEACRTICLIRSFERGRKQSKDGKLELEFADFAIAALIFDGVFVQSLNRHEGSPLETRKAVKVASDSRDGKPVQAEDLAEELGTSLDQAYRRLREADAAGCIRRVNSPEKDNRKFYLPSAQPRFIPDPEKVFGNLEDAGDEVRFVNPLTGQWVTYSRRKSKTRAG
jgi:hypothetical protein